MTSDQAFEVVHGPGESGHWGTIDGLPVTEDVIATLVANAESGFPGATLNPVGRPRSVGSERAKTVTVRLDPERLDAVRKRAQAEHTSASAIMRRALDDYLAS